jgi:ABC-type oligopeptide transport system substrate-binding subunit
MTNREEKIMKKLFSLVLIALLACGCLVACGEKKITSNDYVALYSSDLSNMDYVLTSLAVDHEYNANFVDGLVENDKYGNIVAGIATSYKVEKLANGQSKWTFKLRDDAKWIDPNDKSEKGAVTAHDFVTGLKYVLDPANGSGTASIPMSVLAGAPEYYEAKADDKVEDLGFETVGVKAESDYVLSFTLAQETPYFISMLTYSPFLPVSQALLDTAGANFGKTMFNIWCNGAFLPKTYAAANKIVYEKNAKYYDAAHVYVNEVEQTFVPGTATFSTAREWYEAGTIDAFSVRSQDVEGYKKYVLGEDETGTIKNPADPSCNGILSVGGSTYIGYFNFNRTAWEVNDPANNKTFDEKVNTAKALANKNFRKGFLYGLDVIQMLRVYQEEEPHNWLMRGYTNRELTYDKNIKDYADYVDDVFNRKQGTQGITLTGINQGSDPIFDKEKARAFFVAAKAELIANGMKEGDFPIKVDVIGDMDVEVQLYEQEMYKAINEVAGDIVDIQMNVPNSSDQNSSWGSIINNYDFSMWSGWGPDYADPNSFLHTMCIGGDMVEQLGF